MQYRAQQLMASTISTLQINNHNNKILKVSLLIYMKVQMILKSFE